MNDAWIGPLGVLLLIGCCLLLETGLIGGGLATGLAAFGSPTVGLVVGGVVLCLLGGAWLFRHRQQPDKHHAHDS